MFFLGDEGKEAERTLEQNLFIAHRNFAGKQRALSRILGRLQGQMLPDVSSLQAYLQASTGMRQALPPSEPFLPPFMDFSSFFRGSGKLPFPISPAKIWKHS
jgi:hypothetical protein